MQFIATVTYRKGISIYPITSTIVLQSCKSNYWMKGVVQYHILDNIIWPYVIIILICDYIYINFFLFCLSSVHKVHTDFTLSSHKVYRQIDQVAPTVFHLEK